MSAADALRRIVDVAAAAAGLVVLSPVMGCAALAIRGSMGRGILFRQERVGLHERTFTILKFRTMLDAIGPDGRELPDEVRLTRLGRFLRSTSLDELPQLWNVLRGEMTLVGPRPLLPEYLPLYTPEQRERHRVKPGMTSLVAVNGRNLVTWEDQLQMDAWYVANRSFVLDLRILLLTFAKVVRREGVSQAGHATRERFRGTPANGSAHGPHK